MKARHKCADGVTYIWMAQHSKPYPPSSKGLCCDCGTYFTWTPGTVRKEKYDIKGRQSDKGNI